MTMKKRWALAGTLLLLLGSVPADASSHGPTVTLSAGNLTDSGHRIVYDDEPLEASATVGANADQFFWYWDKTADGAGGDWVTTFDGTTPEGNTEQPASFAAAQLDASGTASGFYTYRLTYVATDSTTSESTEAQIVVYVLSAALRPQASISIAQGADQSGDQLGHPFTLTAVCGSCINPTFDWQDGPSTTTWSLDAAAATHGDTAQFSVTAVSTPFASHPIVGALELVVSGTRTIEWDLRPVFTVDVDLATKRLGQTVTPTINVAYPTEDARSIAYEWKKGDEVLGTEASLLLDSAKMTYGDEIGLFVAVTHDGQGVSRTGSDTATLVNAAPVVSITLPATRMSHLELVANYQATDPDGDAVTCTVQWFKDTVAVGTAATVGNCHQAKTATVPAADTAAGQKWELRVTPSDGYLNGEQKKAEASIVDNQAPVVSSVTLSPTAPRTGDAVTASVVSSDPDGQQLTTTYVWQKQENGAFADVSSLTQSVLPAASTTKGQIWRLKVTVSDGLLSTSGFSNQITIGNTPPAFAQAPDVTVINEGLRLNFTVSDVDGDPLQCTITWTPPVGDPTSNTGACSGAMSVTRAGTPGLWSAKVSVSDGTDAVDASGESTVTAALLDGGASEKRIFEQPALYVGAVPLIASVGLLVATLVRIRPGVGA